MALRPLQPDSCDPCSHHAHSPRHTACWCQRQHCSVDQTLVTAAERNDRRRLTTEVAEEAAKLHTTATNSFLALSVFYTNLGHASVYFCHLFQRILRRLVATRSITGQMLFL